MKVTLRNLGPVNTAEVHIKPLTIFVGPNNSGKSFTASMLYASLSPANLSTSLPPQIIARQLLRILGEEMVTSAVAFLADHRVSEMVSEDWPAEFREVFERAALFVLSDYAFSVATDLERIFGTEAADLRRMSFRQHVAGSLTIASDTPKWDIRIDFRAAGPSVHINSPRIDDVLPLVASRRWPKRARANPELANITGYLRDFVGAVKAAIFANVPNHTKYLPAARSGLMHSHKVISGSLIRQSSRAGLQDMRIPAMSGVVTDFLSELIEIDAHYTGPFFPMARRLEDEVLHGTVQLEDVPSSSTEIMFHTVTGSYPLTRTSSMVSELAPVVVYLKSVLRERDLLIIEEPEAHLHPETQVTLAEILVRLVNAGLKVLITTHSEFFLQQLNNSIVAGSVQHHKTPDLVDEKTAISASDVGVYLFAPTDRGTLAVEQALDEREGVPDVGFDLVSERLYNRNVELDGWLDAEE